MNVLVTGGAGYVGGFAARHLAACGHAVTVLDDLSCGHAEAAPGDSLEQGEISDRKLLAQLLARDRIEAVMHFAASTAVGESVREPRQYYRNNVAGSLALLSAMLDAGVRKLVFSSSCAVYAEDAAMPLTEDSPLAPASPYAFTKLAVERMIEDFSRAYGLGYSLLRYFNAAGADREAKHGEHHDPETHLIPLVLEVALGRRDELQVYGADYPTPDGTCIRDYVHVEDLARAHLLALTALPEEGAFGRVYNLGTGRGSSVLEVIESAARVSGREIPHRVGPRRPGDTPELVAGGDRAKQELGWTVQYPELDTIVESAWAWHRSHPDGY